MHPSRDQQLIFISKIKRLASFAILLIASHALGSTRGIHVASGVPFLQTHVDWSHGLSESRGICRQTLTRPVQQDVQSPSSSGLGHNLTDLQSWDLWQSVRGQVQGFIQQIASSVDPEHLTLPNRDGTLIHLPNQMGAIAAEPATEAIRGPVVHRIVDASKLWSQAYKQGPLAAAHKQLAEQQRARPQQSENELKFSNGLPSSRTVLQKNPILTSYAILVKRQAQLQARLARAKQAAEDRDADTSISLENELLDQWREIRNRFRNLELEIGVLKSELSLAADAPLPKTYLKAKAFHDVSSQLRDAQIQLSRIKSYETHQAKGLLPPLSPQEQAELSSKPGVLSRVSEYEKTLAYLRKELGLEPSGIPAPLDPKMAELEAKYSLQKQVRTEEEKIRSRLIELANRSALRGWTARLQSALILGNQILEDFNQYLQAEEVALVMESAEAKKIVADAAEQASSARKKMEAIKPGLSPNRLVEYYSHSEIAAKEGAAQTLKEEQDVVVALKNKLLPLLGSEQAVLQNTTYLQIVELERLISERRRLENELDQSDIDQLFAQERSDSARMAEIRNRVENDLLPAGRVLKERINEKYRLIYALSASDPAAIWIQKTALIFEAFSAFATEERRVVLSRKLAVIRYTFWGRMDVEGIPLNQLEEELVVEQINRVARIYQARLHYAMQSKINEMKASAANAVVTGQVLEMSFQEVMQAGVELSRRMDAELESLFPLSGTDLSHAKDPRRVLTQNLQPSELKNIPNPIVGKVGGRVAITLRVPTWDLAYYWNPDTAATTLAPWSGSRMQHGPMVAIAHGMGGPNSIDFRTGAVIPQIASLGLNGTSSLYPFAGHLGARIDGVLGRLAYTQGLLQSQDALLGGEWSLDGAVKKPSPFTTTFTGRSMGGWLSLMASITGVLGDVTDSLLGLSITIPRSHTVLHKMTADFMEDNRAGRRNLDPIRMGDADRLCLESWEMIQSILRENPDQLRLYGDELVALQGSADEDGLRINGVSDPIGDLTRERTEGRAPGLMHIAPFFDLDLKPGQAEYRLDGKDMLDRKTKAQGGHFLLTPIPEHTSQGRQVIFYQMGHYDYLIERGKARDRVRQMANTYSAKWPTRLHWNGVSAGDYLNNVGQILGLTQADLDEAGQLASESLNILMNTELDQDGVWSEWRRAAELARPLLYANDPQNASMFKMGLAFRFLQTLIYWPKEKARVERLEQRYASAPRPHRPLIQNDIPFTWLGEGREPRFYYPVRLTETDGRE